MTIGALVRVVGGVLTGRVGTVEEVGPDFVVVRIGPFMRTRLPLDHVKSLR